MKYALLGGLTAMSLLFVWAQQPPSGVMSPVVTRGYDNARTGANLNEKILTVENVRNRGLKQYFKLPLEGDARGAEATPLIVPHIKCQDGIWHDLVIIATMNNLVWAFDANDSSIVWVKKLGYPINSTRAVDMWGIADHWGVTSTPVADPDTNKLYLCAWSAVDGKATSGSHSIVTIDIGTGAILKSVSLSGLEYDPGHGLPVQKWNAAMRKQRSALLLTNVGGVKTVFFGAGSFLETNKGASGWIIAYDVRSEKVSATLAMSARYFGAGIWMAGSGLAADPAGYIYGLTGNGGFDGVTDFAETAFKARYTSPGMLSAGKLEIVDWWTPYSDAGRVGKNPASPSADYEAAKLAGVNEPSEVGKPVNRMPAMPMDHERMQGLQPVPELQRNAAGFSDQDFGSAGPALIPKHHALVAAGKDGIGYVINTDKMGRTMPSDLTSPAANYRRLLSPPVWLTYYPGPNVDPAPQDVTALDFMFDGKTHHQHAGLVTYESRNHGTMLFEGGENGSIRAWSLSAAGSLTYLGCTQEYASWQEAGMPGAFLSLSANGQAPGTAVLWAILPQGDANRTVTNGNLYAYDATNLGTYGDGSGALRLLWKSPDFVYGKFQVPVVSGGRVYVGTYDDKVLCFGLN
jgi:hypothetical protein